MIIKQILDAKGRAVVTIPSDATVADVAGALSANGIGVIVVLDPNEKIAGIVSERDVLRARIERGPHLENVSLADICQRDVLSVSPVTPVDEVVRQRSHQSRGRESAFRCFAPG